MSNRMTDELPVKRGNGLEQKEKERKEALQRTMSILAVVLAREGVPIRMGNALEHTKKTLPTQMSHTS